MVLNRRASESPLEYLQPINDKIDIRHPRRALEIDQVRHLLEMTRTQSTRFGMSGPERAMLYRLAVETGLRANELRSLKKTSFNFVDLTVSVEAGYTKSKKEKAVLPLRKDTAVILQQFLANKLSRTKAFKVPIKTADMIKVDLAAANIPYVDGDGRYADFHSLRHTMGTWLAACGVHPKVAQIIMRHSDINLTMSRYTHIFRGQEAEAINKLPDLSFPSQEAQKSAATGTDGKSVLPENLPFFRIQERILKNSDELLQGCRSKEKTPFPAQNQLFQAKKEAFSQRGRRDSNPQPSDRQSDALTRLSYGPDSHSRLVIYH